MNHNLTIKYFSFSKSIRPYLLT